MNTLDELAIRYGTDKSSRQHGYTAAYDEMFSSIRRNPIRLLEIGVYAGASLRMWRKYFDNEKSCVVGMDNDMSHYNRAADDCFDTFLGSQANTSDLTAVAMGYGPFDIVIDDGSHIPAHNIKSYDALIDFVKPGGWYIIEDTHMHYHNVIVPPFSVIPHMLTHLAASLARHGKTQWASKANWTYAERERLTQPEQEIAEVRLLPSLVMIRKDD